MRLLRRDALREPHHHRKGKGQQNTAMLWMEPWQVKRLRLERAAGLAARPVRAARRAPHLGPGTRTGEAVLPGLGRRVEI